MLKTPIMTATAVAALLATPVLAQTATANPTSPASQPPAPAAVPPQPNPPATLPSEQPAADAVQSPATLGAATTLGAMGEEAMATGTVVDVLRQNGQFSTLVGALDAAQLTETLRTNPAISIFAPTDAAFAALPQATRDRLMDPANAQELRQLLLFHVIVADVDSSQIQGARGEVQTAARTPVQLDGTGASLMIGGATITQADIEASNGAVFAIDRVLTPPAATETAATDERPTEIATAAPGEVRPTDSSMAPAGAPAGGVTQTPVTTPATAPDGRMTTDTTRVAAPPVVSPTDGQQDRPASSPN